MKRVAALLAFICALSFGCWLTKPQPITPTVPDGGYADASAGQTFVNCSEAAVHDVVLGLLPAVETALATQDYAGALAVLVGKYTLAEVACAVSWVGQKAHGMAMTTNDAIEADKEQRAHLWLQSHPVTFLGAQ